MCLVGAISGEGDFTADTTHHNTAAPVSKRDPYYDGFIKANSFFPRNYFAYLPLLTQKDATSPTAIDGIWKQNVTGAIQATVLKHPRLRERIPTDLSVNTDQTTGFTYPYQTHTAETNPNGSVSSLTEPVTRPFGGTSLLVSYLLHNRVERLDSRVN
jgi:hypothetical protein